jgi:tetratricopeptide (TPR) repeat protein
MAMLLTQCAACAAPLGLTLGKKCGRCSTRYCGAECQVQHWKEGGHDQLCKPIKKAGGAEQYNANSRYSEAVAVAVEKCAEDTKGQTCFICTEALHLKTKEGLVRGCACRGTAGFAHVSCLAEQAKLLFEEAEYNNLDVKVMQARWSRWHTCSLCEQMYHGVVMHALGWACWKTYLGRPETDQARVLAMSVLGNGLSIAEHHEDALSVKEAQLSMKRRLGVPQGSILVAQSNIATTYRKLGQLERALQMQRDVYSGWVKLHGEENDETLLAALNYADALTSLERFEEAKALLRRTVPVARRVLGENHEDTLRLKWIYATALCRDDGATLAELREAVTTLEAVEQNIQRVFGRAHPLTGGIGGDLRNARAALAARDVEALGDALGALGAA